MKVRFSRWLAIFVVFVGLFVSSTARAAWTPPPLRGHVVDEAGAFEPEQVLQLDRKLDRARRQSGFAIVVYVMQKLPENLSIEDVGYQAGNAWGVGSKGGDDGVLLLIALEERKIRIETGKGVGGALTDIASSHINREVIAPPLKEGRTYEAVSKGVDAIAKELRANTPGGESTTGKGPAKKAPQVHAQPTGSDYLKMGAILAVVLAVIVLAIVSPAFREILFWVLLFGRFGGGGGGGGRRDDDDDGGSGYGGGGGTFGGGGSSDDY